MIVKPCKHRKTTVCPACWKLRARWRQAKVNKKIAKTLRGSR